MMVLSLSGIIKKKRLKFEDTKGGIGSLKSKKDRQHNGQKKKGFIDKTYCFLKYEEVEDTKGVIRIRMLLQLV
jgi:hypothetical protein